MIYHFRRSTMLCLVLCAALFTAIPAWAANYGAPVELSNNSSQYAFNYYIQINDQGHVVWVSSDSTQGAGNYQLNLYDGTTTKVIRSTTYAIGPPKINANGDVTWTEDGALWLYSNGSATQVTSTSSYSADAPAINDLDQIVFYGENLTQYVSGIFLYDSGAISEFTTDSSTEPAINDSGQIVYEDYNWPSGIHLANVDSGADQVISDSGICNATPEINSAGQAIWLGSVLVNSSCGSDYSVYFYDGSTTKIISNNSDNNALSAWQRGLINSSGQVVWLDMTSGDIYMYSNGTVRNLTQGSTLYNSSPQINDSGEVVWYGQDPATGSDYIYLYSGGQVQPLATFEVNNFADDFTGMPAINNQGQIAYLGNGQQVYLISPSGLWQNAKDLGGGWKWLKWFGYFNTNSSPWIYHMQHGWLYPFGTSTDSIWFYDSAMGTFWWTSATVYPYVYRVSDGAWLYYDEGTSNPRWFYNYKYGKWEKD